MRMGASSTDVLLGESGRGGVSMFSSTDASSGGNVASGCPRTIEALLQTCLTRGPFRSMRCLFAVSAVTNGTGAVVFEDDIEGATGELEVDVTFEGEVAVDTSFLRCLSRLISSAGSFSCLGAVITVVFDVVWVVRVLFAVGALFCVGVLFGVGLLFSVCVFFGVGTSSLPALASTMMTGLSVIIGFNKGELPNVELFSTNALEMDIFGRYSLSPETPGVDASIAGQASNLPTPPILLAKMLVLLSDSVCCSTLTRNGQGV